MQTGAVQGAGGCGSTVPGTHVKLPLLSASHSTYVWFVHQTDGGPAVHGEWLPHVGGTYPATGCVSRVEQRVQGKTSAQ